MKQDEDTWDTSSTQGSQISLAESTKTSRGTSHELMLGILQQNFTLDSDVDLDLSIWISQHQLGIVDWIEI